MDQQSVSAVIPAGAAVSNGFDVYAPQQLSLWMPAAWTAASLTIELSQLSAPATDADWRQLFTELDELILPAAANRVLTITAGIVLPPGIRRMRLVSGVAGARVNQAAERTIDVFVRRF